MYAALREETMPAIAIAGKGGSGKTTIAGTLARMIARQGREVWAIDADSTPNLGITLGLSREVTDAIPPMPRSIIDTSHDADGERVLTLNTPPETVMERYGAAVSQAGCRGPRRSILVAGFGNVLRGDDGFGVEVVRRLAESAVDDDAHFLEVGTGGIALAQELLTPYDRLVIVDAMTRGGAPGTLYVLEVESVGKLTSVDMHMTVPARALELAQALGALPPQIFMVGCEPGNVDELEMGFSDAVGGAVERAMVEVRRLLADVSV